MKTILIFLSVFLSANLFGQNVYIPDANFKAYLVGNSDINTNGDTEVQIIEATAFDGLINCIDLGISDLTGIEAFIALGGLNCNNNELTSLDVSQNTALSLLECSNNELTSLDVSQNPLFYLHCYNNQITSLFVHQNSSLKGLECSNNKLTSLDLNFMPILEYLNCDSNEITNIDISQNSFLDLDYFNCSSNQLTCLNIANGNNANFWFFSVDNNPSLTCIEVDDANFSSATWSEIDSQMYFSEDCNNDCTSSLTELNASNNLIQILDMMGRETSFKPNTPLIYVYDDGSIEKVFSVEY